MKKTYQNPEIEYLFVSPEDMIAYSNGILGTDGPGTIDLSQPTNETDKTSGNLSRINIWDDED